MELMLRTSLTEIFRGMARCQIPKTYYLLTMGGSWKIGHLFFDSLCLGSQTELNELAYTVLVRPPVKIIHHIADKIAWK